MTRVRACLAAAVLAATTARAATVEITVTGRDGRPAADAAVYLESPAARAALRPATGVELAQQDKRFSQSVLVVPVGTEVAFPNRDKVRHHVYSFSPPKNFELKLYIGTPANPVLFDKPGLVVLGCNIHDTMVGWVVVVETPWYAATPAGGSVTLENVPPGSYRLRTWHPVLAPGAAPLDQALVVPSAGARVAVRL